MDLTLETIPVSEALRYLGVKQSPPPDLFQQVEQACARLLPHCRPRYVWRQIAKADLPALGLDLPGEDIHTLLRDCETVVLFALTLGEGAELLIRRAGLRSPTDALVLDACASAACEAACDQLQAMLEGQLCKEGLHPTDRFSPGYGDLPLTVQKPLLELLDAQRRCGITLSPTLIMTPRKSVTAILGVSRTPINREKRSCTGCPAHESCAYRKTGGHCGIL